MKAGSISKSANAVMAGGGQAVSIPEDQRQALIASVKNKWDGTVDEACGAELAGKVRDLLESHAP